MVNKVMKMEWLEMKLLQRKTAHINPHESNKGKHDGNAVAILSMRCITVLSI